MNNVLVRAISGTAYVAIIVAAILAGTWTFLALAILLMIPAITELHRIMLKGDRHLLPLIIDILGSASIIITAGLATCGKWDPQTGSSLLLPTLIYLIIRLITALYIKSINPIASIATSLASQFYISLPLASLVILYNSVATPHIVLGIFILIWLNDTGAFCFGSTLGRHRLFERISPKKSWEGFWGGMAVCIVAAYAAHIFLDNYFGDMTVTKMIGLAVIVSAMATWGDLVESLLKRTANIKDSGNIMPGHGGILDRIDSLLLVAPAALCYFLIVNQ